MSGTYQHPLVAVVPPDAPATGLHETPWYSGDQLPVQIGVYKRLSIGMEVMYSYFDGTHWLVNCRTFDAAMRKPSTHLCLVQTRPWCGLAMPAPGGYGPLPCPARPSVTSCSASE